MIGVILEIWDSENYEVEFVKSDGTNYSFERNYTFTVDSSFFEDVRIINLSMISSIKDLHTKFKLELEFPEFCGMNWDAFWNAITGLIEMPTVLKLTEWKDFSIRFPDDADILSNIATDFNAQFPEKKIIIDR